MKKANDRYHNCGGKEKMLNIILKMKSFQKKMWEIGIETCREKQKKQKGNMEEINTETWKKCKLKQFQRKYQAGKK